MNFEKLKKKICIVVDNPSRDLDGLVLLAHRLATYDCDVFLVPMYSVGYEVPLIGPDFILLNYARTANMQIIKTLSRAGIAIGILDTEGGVWESVEKFAKSVPLANLNDSIDQYYVWGPLQKQAFLQHTQLAENKIFVTGAPRYDFCVSPWNSALDSYDTRLGDYVLVISNFALAFPRFGSPKTEIDNMLAVGFDISYVEARLLDERIASKNLIDLIVKAAKRFPETQFVIRTHPFEDDTLYKSEFRHYNNVKIVREGPVTAWLKSAKMVLHMNSSVSIDAVLMGVPVYTPDWLSTDISRGLSEITLNISIKLSCEADLFKVISGESVGSNLEFDLGKKALSDWFFTVDGKAHERVAGRIVEFLADRQGRVDPSLCKKLFYYGSKDSKNWKGYVDSIGRIIFGAKYYRWVRNNVLTKNLFRGKKSDKFFSTEQVNSILEKLNEIRKSNVKAIEISEHKSLGSRAIGDSVFVQAKTES